MKVSSFRLSESDLKTISETVEFLKSRTSLKRTTKSDALRVLIRRGFGALKQEEASRIG
jgi:hypothetical protein